MRRDWLHRLSTASANSGDERVRHLPSFTYLYFLSETNIFKHGDKTVGVGLFVASWLVGWFTFGRGKDSTLQNYTSKISSINNAYGDESSAMPVAVNNLNMPNTTKDRTRMWANAQRDGRRAEYRWRPLFNAAVWLKPTTRVQCSDAAKTRIPLKLAGVFQTPEPSSAVSGPKFIILWGHVEELLLFNKFFSDSRYVT